MITVPLLKKKTNFKTMQIPRKDGIASVKTTAGLYA